MPRHPLRSFEKELGGPRARFRRIAEGPTSLALMSGGKAAELEHIRLWIPPDSERARRELPRLRAELRALPADHPQLREPPSLELIEREGVIAAALRSVVPSAPNLYQACARSSWTKVAELLVQVLRGLAYLHGQGRLMRELEPRLISVTGRGQRRAPRLIEAGVLDIPGWTEVIGQAPDPRRCEPGADPDFVFDERSDLYSFGVLFYEVACRRMPFGDEPTRAAPVPPREHRANLPRAFEDIITALLAEDPSERPPHANAVIRQLGSAVRKRFAVEPKRSSLRTLYPARWPLYRVEQAAALARLEAAMSGAGSVLAVPMEPGSARSAWLDGLRQAIDARPLARIEARFSDSDLGGLRGLIARGLDLARARRDEGLARRYAPIFVRAFPELDPEAEPCLPLDRPSGESERLRAAIVGFFTGLARLCGGLILIWDQAEQADDSALAALAALARSPKRDFALEAILSEEGEATEIDEAPPLLLLACYDPEDTPGRPAEPVFAALPEEARLTAALCPASEDLRASFAAALGRSEDEAAATAQAAEALWRSWSRSPGPSGFSALQMLHALAERNALRAPGPDASREQTPSPLLADGDLPALLAARWRSLSAAEQDLLGALAYGDEGLRGPGFGGQASRLRALGARGWLSADPAGGWRFAHPLLEELALRRGSREPAAVGYEALKAKVDEALRAGAFARAAELGAALVEASGGGEAQAAALIERSRALGALGRVEEGVAEAERALVLAREARRPREAVRATLALAEVAPAPDNRARAHEALALARELGWDEGRLKAGLALARLSLESGRLHEAAEALEELGASATLVLGRSDRLRLARLDAATALGLGQAARCRERLGEALELVDDRGLRRLEVDLLCLLSELETTEAQDRAARAAAARAVRLARLEGSAALESRALTRLAEALMGSGRPDDALAALGCAQEVARSEGPATRWSVIKPRASLLRRLGRTAEAARALAEVEGGAIEREPLCAAELRAELASLQLSLGEVGRARSQARELARLAEASGLRGHSIEARRFQAEVALVTGDLARGEDLARGAADDGRRLGDRGAECGARLILGRILTELGRLDDALREVREALSLAGKLRRSALQARAELAASRIHRMLGEPARSLEALERGQEHAHRCGDVAVETRSLLELGRFYAENGSPRRARGHLESALEIAEGAGLRIDRLELSLALCELELQSEDRDAPALEPTRERLAAIEPELRRWLRGRRARYEYLRAVLALRLGEGREARRHAEAAGEAARIGRDRLTELAAGLIAAEVVLEERDAAEAYAQAQARYEDAVKMRLAEPQAQALALMARALRDEGDVLGAARACREAAGRIRAIWAELPEALRAPFLERPLTRAVRNLARSFLGKAAAGPARRPSSELAMAVASPALAVPEPALSLEEGEGPTVSLEPLRDKLTGVFNHSYFTSQLEVEVKRAQRHGRCLALMKARIDRFPLLRELHGARQARRILRRVAEVITRNLRDVDIVARYHGEEFELLLADTSREGARLTAERLRSATERLIIDQGGEKVEVSLSMGIAAFPEDARDRDGLVSRADLALERARAAGPGSIDVSLAESAEDETDKSLRDLDALLLSREGRVILSMVNRIMAAQLELDPLAELVTGMIIEATRGQRGFLMTVGEEGELELRYGRNVEGGDPESLEISHNIAREVARSGQAMLIEEAIDDERFQNFKSVLDLRLRSIICAPIALEEEVLGVIYVDHNSIARHFTASDLAFLEAIAERIAVPFAHSRRLQEAERLLREARVQLQASQSALQTKYRYENIIGRSEPMVQTLKLLDRIVDSEHTVFVHGETGTGKELIARAIHFNGPRKDAPFIAENCAALADSVLEGDLFGYVKGAFTGADQDSKGLFELADGGTIFLDEVGDMSERMQKKLLRVLAEGEVRTVGGKKPIAVDVRVLSASNKDLGQLVADGEFREDLFYRLNVITMRLPPLRERKDDIPLLIEHFIARSGSERKIERDALRVLMDYDWPGNIRELENEVRRLLSMTDGPIDASALSPAILKGAGSARIESEEPLAQYYNRPLREVEAEVTRAVILHALEATNWHRTKAAEILKIPTSTLFNKMKNCKLAPRRTGA